MLKTLAFVGCNIGSDVTREVMEHDVCWLFEPIPEVAHELRKQFYASKYRDKVITVIEAACYTDSDKRQFNLYNTNGLSSSLGTMTEQAVKCYAAFDLSLIDTIKVRCVRLSDYLPAFLDTLIIDAQGADLAILRSVEPWLMSKSIASVKTECDGQAFSHYDGLPDNTERSLLQFMADCGYEGTRDVKTVSYNPDYFFEPMQ